MSTLVRRLKRWLFPRSLMARVQVLVILPIVFVISLSAFAFFERHWHEVQTVLVRSLVREIAFLLKSRDQNPSYGIQRAAQQLDITVVFQKGRVLPKQRKISQSTTDQMMALLIEEWLARDFDIDSGQDNKRIELWVQKPEGVYYFVFHRKRIESFTIRLMVGFVLVSAFLFNFIAAIVMRNQIRPIVRLTRLMRENQHLNPKKLFENKHSAFRFGGATEVRELTQVFYHLQRRSASNFAERSEMLRGISHDLRTPLTRMNLQLQMIEPNQDIDALKSDIALMTRMINSYLQFIENNDREQPQSVSAEAIVTSIRERWTMKVSEDAIGARLILPKEALDGQALSQVSIFIRPELFGRCLDNLIDNGLRFAQQVCLEIVLEEQNVVFRIADDGPGIPEDQYARMLEPFQRLDENRMAKSGGSGLGLAMAKETALIHNGEIMLGSAKQGGLLVVMNFPRMIEDI